MTAPLRLARSVVHVLVLLCVVASVAGTSTTGAPEPTASVPDLQLVADVSQFDPGNIISDGMFFDANALTAQQVQDFIAAKGRTCVPSSTGIPCLKDYRETTFTRAPDGICDGTYTGAAGETPGMIIWKVGQACGISPKVLLVLLQKEQALITASGNSLTARRYQIAAGMGCPDTAACDTQYYGFYNQVYSAARQYQRYATYPRNYAYRAGQTNTIQWSPTAACGTSQVYIANQATAGLYNYTPYRPNAAALGAGYGTGDTCSAYGNRNFWLYFTDWFGSTQSPGGDALLAAYSARGGASGPLGTATSGVICGLAAGGCGQVFANGTLYWTAGTGVRAVSEPALTAWGSRREGGTLGYPVSEYACGMAQGGCGQAFQNGRIYYTWSTGAHVLTGAVQDAWIAQGWEAGPLGYPTTDLICGMRDSGCGQVFQGGRIYSTPTTGTYPIAGAVQSAWIDQGYENGALGYPVTGLICGMRDSGCGQVFQGGRIYSTPTTGTHALTGTMQAAWINQGWETGPLGYPTGDLECGLVAAGCRQSFQGGTLLQSRSTGTFAVPSRYTAAWTATGAETGNLGYPVTGLICGMRDSGCGQVFQGGTHLLHPHHRGALHHRDAAHGLGQPGLRGRPPRVPHGDSRPVAGGLAQDFQGGTLVTTTTTGVRTVRAEYAAAYRAAGGESGTLGLPVTDLICGMRDSGCGQVFQGGRIYSTPATGAHVITGEVQTAWTAAGWENGTLGYPTGDLECGLAGGGCRQLFQGGAVYTSPATGPFPWWGASGPRGARPGPSPGPWGTRSPARTAVCG